MPSIQSGDTGLGSGTLGDDTLSVLFSIAEICLPVMEPRFAVSILGFLCSCQVRRKQPVQECACLLKFCHNNAR